MSSVYSNHDGLRIPSSSAPIAMAAPLESFAACCSPERLRCGEPDIRAVYPPVPPRNCGRVEAASPECLFHQLDGHGRISIPLPKAITAAVALPGPGFGQRRGGRLPDARIQWCSPRPPPELITVPMPPAVPVRPAVSGW